MITNLFDDDGLTVDPDDPPAYAVGRQRLTEALGGERIGVSLYRLEPGQAVCPYHYELGEEEWLVVIAGTPTLRTPAGERVLATGDVACFPPGPDGAHQVANPGPEPARVLLMSERALASASVYPDSGKVGVRGSGTDLLFRAADAVDYYDGE